MQFLVSALFRSLASLTFFALTSAAHRVCGDKTNTQAEMTAYTNDEAARVDAKLNTTYQALLASVVSYLVGVLCFEVW